MRRFLTGFLMLLSLATKAQWSPATFPSNFTYFDLVHYLNKDTIIGTTYNGTVISLDGGQTFDWASNLVGGAVSSVSFQKNTITYLYHAGNLMSSKDLGKSWKREILRDSLSDTVLATGFISQNVFKNGKGYTLGLKGSGKPRLFLTRDSGNTWFEADSNQTSISRPIGSSNFHHKMFVFDSTCIMRNPRNNNIFWVFEKFGDTAYETDVSHIHTGANKIVRGFAFENADTGLFITTEQKIFRTEDRMKTFKQVTERSAVTIAYAPKGQINSAFYILGSLGEPGSYYSTDRGDSWKAVGDLYKHFTIDFWNADIGVSSDGAPDNIRYFNGILSSVNEPKSPQEKILLFPNPGNSQIQIKYIGSSDQFFITNLLGEIVYSGRENPINTEKLPDGIYLVQCLIKNQEFRLKWIKQRN